MHFAERKLVMNNFFNSQLSYCALTWMLHNHSNNNKIKHLHERCPRLVYHYKQSSYEQLLDKVESVSKYHKKRWPLQLRCSKLNITYPPKIVPEIFISDISHHLA